MSIFKSITVACPACAASLPFDVVHSVNVDRRSVLRDEILAETFQRKTCPRCDHSFRLDPEFVYVDLGRGQWISAQPLAELPQWAAKEAQAQALFGRVYGAQATPLLQDTGKQLNPRVTFGWAALREKLLAGEHGLDDVTLEQCKAALMRDGGSAPIDGDTELRLVDVAASGDLVFAWLFADDEQRAQSLQLERSVYDDAAADADGAWAALRSELAAGCFVDLNRLMISPP